MVTQQSRDYIDLQELIIVFEKLISKKNLISNV